MLCTKFGFIVSQKNLSWIQNFLPKLQENMIDYTLFFRNISEKKFITKDDFNIWITSISRARKTPDNLYESYEEYLSLRSIDIAKNMLSINPRFILRNWMLEECIEKAEA